MVKSTLRRCVLHRSESGSPVGNSFQWWVFDGDEGEYSAIGVCNQFI
jgi:hypothetical protein